MMVGGAPPQQINTRARGHSSQKNDQPKSQVDEQCQEELDKKAGQAEQQNSKDQAEQHDATTTDPPGADIEDGTGAAAVAAIQDVTGAATAAACRAEHIANVTHNIRQCHTKT